MPRLAPVHGRLAPVRKELLFEGAVIAAMLAIYAANKLTPAFDDLLPFEIAKNHLNDACAGLLFPAYVNTLCIIAGSRWRVASFASSLKLAVLCCIAWEVAAPAIVPWSVGDPIDCLCYLAGGLAYAAIRRCVTFGENPPTSATIV